MTKVLTWVPRRELGRSSRRAGLPGCSGRWDCGDFMLSTASCLIPAGEGVMVNGSARGMTIPTDQGVNS